MNTRFGDMAELVECARLEIAYTGNCIEGSNPPISATNNKMSRWGIFFVCFVDFGIRTRQEGSNRSRKADGVCR